MSVPHIRPVFMSGGRHPGRVVAVRRRRADDPAALHHLAALGLGELQAEDLCTRQPPARDGTRGEEVRILRRLIMNSH